MNLSLWIFVTLETLNIPYSNDEGMLTPPNPCVCACVLASIITRCVRYICGFFCSAMFMYIFFYPRVNRKLAEAFLSVWTDWRCRGPAGHQLGGSAVLHTSEFKGQWGLTSTIIQSTEETFSWLYFVLCYNSTSMSSWCFFWAFECLDFHFERCNS